VPDKLTALTAYLSRRSGEAAYGHPQYWFNYLLPPVTAITEQDIDTFARYLLEDVEFQAIKLGTWSRTAEGRIVITAVEYALPPVYRPYTRLFVAALQRAAQLQHEGKKQEAAPWVGVAAGAAVLIGWIVLGGSGS
jgi:hypothetical protein